MRWWREWKRRRCVERGGQLRTATSAMRHKTEADARATLRRFEKIRDVESYSVFQGSPGTDFPWHLSVTYMADGPFKGVI